MVAAPGMLLNAGKKMGGRVPPVPYLRDSCAIVTRPSIWLKDCSCLVRFSTTFLHRPWTDLAWELKLEGLSALFSYF